MAHYVFLNKNNIVTEVITGVDETELIEGLTPENWYGNFRGQICKRTSYNTYGNSHTLGNIPFRGNYAGIGYYYDEEWDAFIAPKPFDSWVLDYDTFLWEAPIPQPEDVDGYVWKWGELGKKWIKVKVE